MPSRWPPSPGLLKYLHYKGIRLAVETYGKYFSASFELVNNEHL
jgi:hypothetical protein